VLVAVVIAAVTLEVFLSEPRLWFADFRIAYFPAGLATLHGESLSALIERGVTGFVNLPIVAYLFVPFALLPWKLATAGAFPILGVLAIVAAFILLARLARLSFGATTVLMLLFAFNGPLIYSFKLGNTSHFVLLALVGALWLIRAEKSAAAGALLALAALIKLPLLLLAGYFVVRRDWAGAAGFTLILLGAGILSLLVFGLAVHKEWLDFAVLQFSNRVLGAFNVQSIPAMFVRLRGTAPPLFDWTPLDPTPLERLGTKIVQVALVATAAWGLWRCSKPSQQRDEQGVGAAELQFLVMLVLALILSPLSWSHYYCWLLIPAAFALGGQLSPQSSRILLVTSCAAIALSSPLVIFPHLTSPILTSVYTRLVVSNYFIGGVVWFAALIVACRWYSLPTRDPQELAA
jgi:alpha-1,2-mannosyltransferase